MEKQNYHRKINLSQMQDMDEGMYEFVHRIHIPDAILHLD